MTKQEYMKQLEEKLKIFDDELAKEIICDYEEHFRDGSENGKSEEEICEELGNIDEMVKELCQLYEPKKKEEDESNYQFNMNDMVNDALHLANNVADTIVKGIKSSIDYGKRTWYEKSKEDVVDAECTSEKIYNCRKALINAECADVHVIVSENEEFMLEYINHGSLKDKILYHFHSEQKGDTFYGRLVREQASSSLFQMMKTPEIEIILKVPQDFDALDITSLSGDITLNEVKIKETNLYTASGDIKIENCETEKNAVESASGDITLNHVNGNVLKLKSKSGDISIVSSCFKDVTGKCKSGDLNGTESCMDKLSVDTASGSVHFDKLTSESAGINGKSGDIGLTESQIKDINVAAESGSIHMDHVEAEKMEAACSSGDIEICAKAGCFTLNNVSGDIKLKSEEETNGSIQSSSGNIDIELINGDGGYSADISLVSGNATLEFENGSKHGMKKGIYTMGEGKSAFVVSNSSGNIKIHA